MSLPSLPHELLLSISDELKALRHINALARSNKRLYWHPNNYLYSLDVQETGGSALWWAAEHDSGGTAWLSLTEGADAEAVKLVTIPHQLRRLGFDCKLTRLAPLQTALCYGSDSVAVALIRHSVISSLAYPRGLCNCTNIHMAAATGLPLTLKLLLNRGMNVEAQDIQLRTPLHYAATMQPQNSLGQEQVVVLLLAHNANPMREDLEGMRPVSIGKKRSNPVVKMLSTIPAYESSFPNQEVFRMWQIATERLGCERQEKPKEKQPIKCVEQERHRRKRKKRVAVEQATIATPQEREETGGRTPQSLVQTCVMDAADRLAATRIEVETKAVIENAWLVKQDIVREGWSRMRKETDQRSRVTSTPGLQAEADCNHPSGLWKCRVRKTCQSCGVSAKRLSLCTDCGFMSCMRCIPGTWQERR